MTAMIRPVPLVDLDRYMGDRFEIERFPNRFRWHCVGDVRAATADDQTGTSMC
jgi:lipocalin